MTPFFPEGNFNWYQQQGLPNIKFVCDFRNATVSSVRDTLSLLLCPRKNSGDAGL